MADKAKPDVKPSPDQPRRFDGDDATAEVDRKPVPESITDETRDGDDATAEVDIKVDPESPNR